MEPKPATSFWHEFFGFLKSTPFMVIFLVVMIGIGAVTTDMLERIIDAVKGLLQQ